MCMEKNTSIEKIREIEQEVFKIYDELVEIEEISTYKSILIGKKINLLISKLYYLVKNTINEDQNKREKILEKLKKYRILILISLIVFLIFPLIGLILSGTYLWLTLKLKEKLSELIKPEEKDDIFNKVTDLSNTVTNIYTFLEKKSEKRIQRLANERIDNMNQTLNVYLANTYLQLILSKETESDLVTVSNEVAIILVKMLQEDLETEESDLETLLSIAKIKISTENLKSELKLSRILPKMEEK